MRSTEIDRAQFLSLPETISLNHCGVSPSLRAVVDGVSAVVLSQAKLGNTGLAPGRAGLELMKRESGALLNTSASNISFVDNCSVALSMIANGFPFQPGDQILSYRYEYPANHYPWKQQERRGAELRLIEGSMYQERPLSWQLSELESLITDRTVMVAVSHVQFTSGFACDLRALGALCRERKIALVVDVAQSLGCMPIYPEQLGIDALVSSGWKWLMGPLGAGVLYTSPEFRQRLSPTLLGPDMMKQGSDYLNHTFDPVDSGALFEPSTVPSAVVAGFGAALKEGINRYGIERIWERVQQLQQILLDGLDRDYFTLAPLAPQERGGILSFVVAEPSQEIVTRAHGHGVIVTARGFEASAGRAPRLYLRAAPHFYLEENDVQRAAMMLNEAAYEARKARR